jgi:hypothetical protein
LPLQPEFERLRLLLHRLLFLHQLAARQVPKCPYIRVATKTRREGGAEAQGPSASFSLTRCARRCLG